MGQAVGIMSSNIHDMINLNAAFQCADDIDDGIPVICTPSVDVVSYSKTGTAMSPDPRALC